MYKFKKNILISCCVLIAFIFVSGLTTFIIDPLQHYRKASFYEVYTFNQRYLAWGLLKNYEYDSMLLGSSMTENFKTDEMNDDLNINILRVPFQGTSAYEESLLIEKGLLNKNLKNIFLGLDFFSFRGDVNRIKYGEKSLPFYLMNDTFLDDFKYLLNIDVFFEKNIKIIMSNYFGYKRSNLDFNTFWNWDTNYKYSKELCLQGYNHQVEKKDQFKLEELKKSFNHNFLKHVEQNKDINFKVFFPPYSILSWKAWEKTGQLNNILEFKKYILNASLKYNNFKIYDFQIEKEVTHDLDNYFDASHYSSKTNTWMIKQIKDNKYIVTEDNTQDYLDKLKFQVDDFNISDIYK